MSAYKRYFEWSDKGYPLFQYLETKPAWWVSLTTNYPNDIYVNIRKNGHLNVYTHGGSLMELSCDKNNQVVARIHKSYLGFRDDDTKPTYITEYSPEYITSKIDEILERIHSDAKFSGEKDSSQEGCSEKFIQSEQYLSRTNGRFVDTEFAVMRPVTEEELAVSKLRLTKKGKSTDKARKYKEVRIDFTEILPDGRIQFVELKRISDPRLNTHQGDPEIVTQMREYLEMVASYDEAEVVNYYRNVLDTLRKIGACPADLLDVKITGLSRDVRLSFFNYKQEYHRQEGKSVRLAEIKKTLTGGNKFQQRFNSNIEEIIKEFNS